MPSIQTQTKGLLFDMDGTLLGELSGPPSDQ